MFYSYALKLQHTFQTISRNYLSQNQVNADKLLHVRKEIKWRAVSAAMKMR